MAFFFPRRYVILLSVYTKVVPCPRTQRNIFSRVGLGMHFTPSELPILLEIFLALLYHALFRLVDLFTTAIKHSFGIHLIKNLWKMVCVCSWMRNSFIFFCVFGILWRHQHYIYFFSFFISIMNHPYNYSVKKLLAERYKNEKKLISSYIYSTSRSDILLAGLFIMLCLSLPLWKITNWNIG